MGLLEEMSLALTALRVHTAEAARVLVPGARELGLPSPYSKPDAPIKQTRWQDLQDLQEVSVPYVPSPYAIGLWLGHQSGIM